MDNELLEIEESSAGVQALWEVINGLHVVASKACIAAVNPKVSTKAEMALMALYGALMDAACITHDFLEKWGEQL